MPLSFLKPAARLAALIAFASLPMAGRADDTPPSAAEEAEPVQAGVTVDLTRPLGREVRAELFGAALSWSEIHMPKPEFVERLPRLELPFLSLSLGKFGDAAAAGMDRPLDWTKVDLSLSRLKEVHTGPLMIALGGPPSTAKGGWFDVGNEEHCRYWGEVLVKLVQRVEAAGVRAEWWELWNEPDGHWGKADTESFEKLWKFYNIVAARLKAHDPSLKLGGPALAAPYTDLLRRYLDVCGDHIDFISYHQYGSGRYDLPTADFLGMIVDRHIGNSRRVRQLVDERFGGAREVPVFLTEYNMNYGWRPGEERQLTAVNAVFTTLATMLAGGNGVDQATIWGAYADSRFGLIRPETGDIIPAGHALRQLALWAPGSLAETSVQWPEEAGGKPALRAFATLHPDRQGCTVILVNTGETAPLTASLGLRHREPRRVTACEQYEVGSLKPQGHLQTLDLVPQMNEIAVPPMSVVLQRVRFDRPAALD